jgi:alkylation response protein AidB-like acyl-CoA dehydrogenase
VLSTTIPSRADFVRRAAEAAEVLRANALWNSDNRRLHEESLEALTEAGVFKMRVPARYGGYESDAATIVDVITEIAKGDGSASWNLSAWTVSAWMACQFPDHVQDEVFGSDVRVCGVLTPSAAATPVSGGFRVSGSWHFISGAWHSKWQVALAMAPTPDGADVWPVMALIPLADLRIDDDWNTSGLRGTGSVTTIADDVFVPQDKVVPLVPVLQDQSASALNPASPAYKIPMIVTGCVSFSGTAIGLAKAAHDAFVERLDRKITYTDYGSQREAAVTHLAVAEAAMKIEEAEAHALKLAAIADRKSAEGEAWTVEERIRVRGRFGRLFRLAREAAEIYSDESGGSSIYVTSPIRRVTQDLQALSSHALMHPSTNAELFGRMLCGLPPNTMYL